MERKTQNSKLKPIRELIMDKEFKLVTDKLLIAERKIACVCIHCGSDFDDNDGWKYTPVCEACCLILPSQLKYKNETPDEPRYWPYSEYATGIDGIDNEY